MAEIHTQIETQGLDLTRRFAATKHERALVETAAAVMLAEQDGIAYSHAGFAMTSLPHKATAETVWRREGYSTTLLIQSGVDRRGKHVGLPYGSLARMMLLYLQSEAIKSNSPEVPMGSSMNRWMRAMGINVGGKTYKLVRDQAYRISTCNLVFITDKSGHEDRQRAAFVDRVITMLDTPEDQPTLWQESVTLNNHFFLGLKEHPFPISEAAIRAIGGRSQVLDIYIWLCYRLHVLTKPQPVTWASLYGQFGATYSAIRQFRGRFKEALEVALAAYPGARVELTDTGLLLKPSKPAVAYLSV